MSGANATLNRQAIAANNLANVNTTGYREQEAAFRALPVVHGGFPTRAYVVAETPAANFTPGPITRTGRPLDVAINGAGWIVVQGPNGKRALTRNGNLTISATGILETARGNPVVGISGHPISVPPMRSLVIGADGTVSGVAQGSELNSPIVLGQIQLVNPPTRSLTRLSGGLFRSNKPLVADASIRLEPRALEGSNVNSVNTLLHLIQDSRSFETQIRLAKTSVSDSKSAAQILQL